MAKAAKHHLFVQFHGSSKPSGLHRTYPNEFTREGTLNYENFKGCMVTTADHDISMPFIGWNCRLSFKWVSGSSERQV